MEICVLIVIAAKVGLIFCIIVYKKILLEIFMTSMKLLTILSTVILFWSKTHMHSTLVLRNSPNTDVSVYTVYTPPRLASNR